MLSTVENRQQYSDVKAERRAWVEKAKSKGSGWAYIAGFASALRQ
jgi:hypothetical protein